MALVSRVGLPDAPTDRPWGTFSTFYMDAAEGREDTVPRRVRETIPDVKLIAIIRDPVARAISHHRMSVMKRLEERAFADAVDELLRDDELAEARRRPTEGNSYITRGEYGRSLANYLELFPREQLLVVFAEDLEREPAQVLRSIFSYVGVDPDFEPPNLGERYRRAGDERRIGWLDLHTWRARLADQRSARAAWERVPAGARRAVDRRVRVVSYRVELWNARRRGQQPSAEIDPAVTSRLVDHYRPDVERLRELTRGRPAVAALRRRVGIHETLVVPLLRVLRSESLETPLRKRAPERRLVGDRPQPVGQLLSRPGFEEQAVDAVRHELGHASAVGPDHRGPLGARLEHGHRAVLLARRGDHQGCRARHLFQDLSCAACP